MGLEEIVQRPISRRHQVFPSTFGSFGFVVEGAGRDS
jgi:hypothetical protein